MATVVLVQVWPFDPATGAEVAFRLAGGGTKAYQQLGFGDWRSGITSSLRIQSAFGFDKTGFTGGALPQAASFRFFPSDRTLLSNLGNHAWDGARIQVNVGDDEKVGETYPQAFLGTVASMSTSGGALTITLADLSLNLATPACPDTFAGTGDLEGGDDATGRVKRRTFGYVFNVQGNLLDKPNNIYEFGDPNRPLQDMPMVKDKGRSGPTAFVGWQGSALATLTALRAATPPSGGAVIAPSIACVKWWTTPAGPLTADLKGEVGTGYVESAPEIAARIAGIYSPTITIGNLAAAIGFAPGTSGIHIDSASETAANALDRLLTFNSVLWSLGVDGVLTFRHVAWTASTETITFDTIERQDEFAPLDTRKVGFQRNYRVQSDSEISAALLLATDATYVDGTPIETLKPGTPGATRNVPRGNWYSGGLYNQGDIVADNGGSYIAASDVPMGTPTSNATYWTRLVDSGTPGSPGADGRTPIVHFAYADSPDGFTNFTTSDQAGGRAYIGIYTDYTAADSGNPATYSWSLFKGADGSAGTPGTPGAPGSAGVDGISALKINTVGAVTWDGHNLLCPTRINSWTANGAYSTNVIPGGVALSFQRPNLYDGANEDAFVGIASLPVATLDYPPVEYAWRMFKDVSGYTAQIWHSGSFVYSEGWNGSYIYTVRYDPSTGNVTFYHFDPSSNVTTAVFSIAAGTGKSFGFMATAAGAMSVTNVAFTAAGGTGATGSAGNPGSPGAPAYLHTAYATAADGSSGFSFSPSGATYLGTYSDNNPTASGDYHAYSWVLIKGQDGAPGTPGSGGFVAFQVAGVGTWNAPYVINLANGQAISVTVNNFGASLSSTRAGPANITAAIQGSLDGFASYSVIASASISVSNDSDYAELDPSGTFTASGAGTLSLRVVVTKSGNPDLPTYSNGNCQPS